MRDAQRLAALSVQRVLDGSTLPAALAKFAPPEQGAPGRRRALVQELAYGTLRHWGRLDALVRSLATKPIADPSLRCLVAVAIYQLLHTRAPSFAVVDHAVNAAAILARPAAKALVNALLRRFMREREALEEAVVSDPVARWSHPRWWVERVQREFPADWQDVLASGNAQAPLALRVNGRVATRDALLSEFAAAGVNATPAGDARNPRRSRDERARVAGIRSRRVLGPGSGCAAGGTALAAIAGPARARRLRGARGQDHAPARACRGPPRRARPR